MAMYCIAVIATLILRCTAALVYLCTAAVQVEIMIRRGTIGSHRYYCIMFRRQNPELMMLVTDRQVCDLVILRVGGHS